AMDLVPLVAVQATYIGETHVRQRTGGQDDRAGTKTLAVLGSGRPHAGVVVEGQAADLVVEPDMTTDVELGRHVFEVTADLRRGGVGARPCRVLDERVRVQQRRDVTTCAGIGGVTP